MGLLNFNSYDNLDEVTDVTRYYDQANTFSLADNEPNSGDPIIGRSGAAYDNLGQQYRTIASNEPGTIAIISNMWYDPDGNTIMTLPGESQQFVKEVYDGLDEPTVTYTGHDPSNSAVTYTAAGSVSGGIILTQSNDTFDLAGDSTLETDYSRLPGDTTTTGALTTSDARVYYVADWYDGLGRNVAEQDFGTAVEAPSPSSAAPTGVGTSGATQVSFTPYNARGEDELDTDAAGRVTKNIDDDAGRSVETIQNYTLDDGQPATDPDTNLISATTCHVTQQIASTATLSPYGGDSIDIAGESGTTFSFIFETDPISGGLLTPPSQGSMFVMYDASTGAAIDACGRFDNEQC